MANTQAIQKKNFASPDETRPFDKAEVAIVELGGTKFMRGTLQPGWRWSQSLKPTAKTDSCQAPHLGVLISGRLHVVSDTGAEDEFGPGDVYQIAPGHDAWVVGTNPVVSVDVTAAEVWGKPTQ